MAAAKKSSKIKLDEDPFAFLEEEKKKKVDNLEDFQFFDQAKETSSKAKKTQNSGWTKLDIHSFPKQDLDFNKLFK